jgi:DNA recombination protein RmuC
MESLLITIGVLVIFLLLAIFFFLNKRITNLMESKRDDQGQQAIIEWLKTMQGSLDKNLGQVQTQMQKSNSDLNERLDKAARVISEVNKEIGQMNEIGRGMKELQDLLKSPKLRGNVGEQILRDLLEQILPREHYSLQYKFSEGKTVDAIIKTDRGIIPIDSKFPMESFMRVGKASSDEERVREMRTFIRDVKKHIDDISDKYILPQEGTVDFALMYIPSEPVYYEIMLNETDLNNHAHRKKILMVSPNSFYYFLKIVLMGLQEKRIAEGAKKILETLEGIRHEASKFDSDLQILSGHVNRTKNSMDSVTSKFQLLTGKIEKVSHLSAEEAPLELEIEDTLKIR